MTFQFVSSQGGGPQLGGAPGKLPIPNWGCAPGGTPQTGGGAPPILGGRPLTGGYPPTGGARGYPPFVCAPPGVLPPTGGGTPQTGVPPWVIWTKMLDKIWDKNVGQSFGQKMDKVLDKKWTQFWTKIGQTFWKLLEVGARAVRLLRSRRRTVLCW